MIQAYAANAKGQAFEAYSYDPGPLGDFEVQVNVTSCGICHSDLSMLDNEWGMTAYPFVGGHEIIGTVDEVGPLVKHLKPGQTVGIGWFSGSCMTCDQCLSGSHNLCGQGAGTIVGRHGGFADKVRSSAEWVFALPDGLDPLAAGPLFCGGITVFSPFLSFDIKPTDRVGIIGIGGLGHMAIMFANKWGCEVTAFSTSQDKQTQAQELGAHHFVNVKEPGALDKLAGSLDLIINTTNAGLDWDAYINALSPKGRLHMSGAVLSPVGANNAFPLIMGQKSISGSPVGSPIHTKQMLDFCARHQIQPVTETYQMNQINDAFEKLRTGSPRYRLVLTA